MDWVHANGMECVGCNWEENLVEWKGEGKSVTVDMQNEKHDSRPARKRKSVHISMCTAIRCRAKKNYTEIKIRALCICTMIQIRAYALWFKSMHCAYARQFKSVRCAYARQFKSVRCAYARFCKSVQDLNGKKNERMYKKTIHSLHICSFDCPYWRWLLQNTMWCLRLEMW